MKRHRINGQIQAKQVRVVDDAGQEMGVLLVSDALRPAAGRREDLVEAVPDAVPPVCQMIDYGKFRY